MSAIKASGAVRSAKPVRQTGQEQPALFARTLYSSFTQVNPPLQETPERHFAEQRFQQL
jgi:hypothetical protein